MGKSDLENDLSFKMLSGYYTKSSGHKIPR